MNLPVIHQTLDLLIKGKTHHVTCTDLFDGGSGYYFDALFPTTSRYRFESGEQCMVQELGEERLVEFVSYPKSERQIARFFFPKWS